MMNAKKIRMHRLMGLMFVLIVAVTLLVPFTVADSGNNNSRKLKMSLQSDCVEYGELCIYGKGQCCGKLVCHPYAQCCVDPGSPWPLSRTN